jgi:anaphase-promoting complex subunit 6
MFPSPLAADHTPNGANSAHQSTFLGSVQQITPNNSIGAIGTAANDLSAADRLRLWRHDALMQHHYKTAEYIGDKVLALTGDPNDTFWLAQVYYNNGDYFRARQLLAKKQLDTTSFSCRYLAALCLMKMEKWDEALDIVGETNPFKNVTQKTQSTDGGIKWEASLCFIRGQIYANQNNLERAKECYQEAVFVDVKCYEAFDELIRNNMLKPLEEWELLMHLDFSELGDNDEFIHQLYTTRLNKFMHAKTQQEAHAILQDEYAMAQNSDVLLSRAEVLYMQCRFQKCLELCDEILKEDELNFATLPTYLACLHEVGGKNKLYITSHKLAEHYPKRPITWLAVGIYYLSINNISEARKYFSRASSLNPNFCQAWIGFAHTFAAEGEHDQAIAAYATASRFFPGSYLPNLFLGMQYLQMGNLTLASEYLLSAFFICPKDPLLLNEMGVMNYHKGELTNAETYLNQALQITKEIESDSKAWVSIHANLGHVYRRMSFYTKALASFDEVLKVTSNDANIYSAIGLIYLKTGDISKAIENLHYSLAISKNDPVAQDLLKRALEENVQLDSQNDFFSKHKILIHNATKTPLLHRSKNVGKVNTLNGSVDQIANDLINGEDSSDDDDDAIMEIESD